MKRSILTIALIFVTTLVCAQMKPRPIEWAQPMMDAPIGNFFKINDDVYRSEQPDEEDLKALEQHGIRSILNLRRHHSDKDEAKNSTIKQYAIKMSAAKIKDDLIEEAMLIIARAEKPILIHCWHGSDRTGVVIAMYRMVFQNWAKAEAIDEFKNGGYGYHQKMYPNIEKYLMDVDLSRFKKAVAAVKQPDIKK